MMLDRTFSDANARAFSSEGIRTALHRDSMPAGARLVPTAQNLKKLTDSLRFCHNLYDCCALLKDTARTPP